MSSSSSSSLLKSIEVDVIVPVHNASATLRDTIASAMHQVWLNTGDDDDDDDDQQKCPPPNIRVSVCCYNDASTDDSWSILQQLHQHYDSDSNVPKTKECQSLGGSSSDPSSIPISTQLFISSSPEGSTARGAGYARNRAVAMRSSSESSASSSSSSSKKDHCRFLCWLDSDDLMHPARIYHQVTAMLRLDDGARRRTLVGGTFDRVPADATWHYTAWANGLTEDRLMLERFREITVIQPTWMMCRDRFERQLRGYLEAPEKTAGDAAAVEPFSVSDWVQQQQQQYSAERSTKDDDTEPWRLVHPAYDTPTTLRVAEDLRFFHEHLVKRGRLQICRTDEPLVTYRHRAGQSQCAQTPRKLLLYLRVAAFEKAVLLSDSEETSPWRQLAGGAFVVWGAGRDGKDFVKALSPALRQRVYCMIDVDDKKIERGFYVGTTPDASRGDTKHRKGRHNEVQEGWKIPIVHFSLAARDPALRSRLYRAWKHGEDGAGVGPTDVEAIAPHFGSIDKSYKAIMKHDEESCSRIESAGANEPNSGEQAPPPGKKAKTTPTAKLDPAVEVIDRALLPELPVVVCVAMYRTNGALESNLKMIGRTEGIDLWHFS